MTTIDNTKPFTFSGRLKPGFTKDGLYNAANLMVVANDTLWQKFCFEQDERGKHRVVTVRTVGTSDDNNHEVIEQDNIYYKISSDTHTIASYFLTSSSCHPKFFVKEFSYFLMPCHQHGLGVNLLVQR